MTRIQFRKDTSAGWAAAGNPVLADSELGMDTTTDTYKIGDGVTAWNLLVPLAKVTTVSAGTGLTGGGTTAADRSLAVDFAGSGSANTVARSDHTHASIPPQGVIKLSTTTGTTTGSGTTAQTSNVAIWNGDTFTLAAQRLVRLFMEPIVQVSAADIKASLVISIDGTQRLRWADVICAASTTTEPNVPSAPFVLASGSHTITATISKVASAVAATANVANTSTLKVEDLGPA